jgi:hypothetical protein
MDARDIRAIVFEVAAIAAMAAFCFVSLVGPTIGAYGVLTVALLSIVVLAVTS